MDKKKLIIGIPKVKRLIKSPLSRFATSHYKTTTFIQLDENSLIKLKTGNNVGVIEQDLLYVYLLLVLRNKKALTESGHDLLDVKQMIEKTTINVSPKKILQSLGKRNLGGSNYKQLYKSNIKLAETLLTWKLHNPKNGKYVRGASSLIDFSIDQASQQVIVKVCSFYLYYLLKPYRNQLKSIAGEQWARFTLLNLKERFTLKTELQKYAHEWLSHTIFPNDHPYRIVIDDIIDDMKLTRSTTTDKIWLKNTRYDVTRAIRNMCKKLDSWELIDTRGRGVTRAYIIKRRKFTT